MTTEQMKELQRSFIDAMRHGNSMVMMSPDGIKHITRDEWVKPAERIDEGIEKELKLAYLRGYEDRMNERDYDFHSHHWDILSVDKEEDK